MGLLDIIIVNYNSTDYLLRCIRSVYNSLHKLPAKVFVQDNASDDGVDRVKSDFPQVQLTKNSYKVKKDKYATASYGYLMLFELPPHKLPL